MSSHNMVSEIHSRRASIPWQVVNGDLPASVEPANLNDTRDSELEALAGQKEDESSAQDETMRASEEEDIYDTLIMNTIARGMPPAKP